MVRQVRVSPGEIIVLLKGLRVSRVLKEGKHFIFGSYQMRRFNLNQEFIPDWAPIELVLQDEVIAAELEVVELGPEKAALIYEGGVLVNATSGRSIAIWKSSFSLKVETYSMSESWMPKELPKAVLQSPVLASLRRVVEVERGSIALLWIDGEYIGQLQPGRSFFWQNGKQLITRTVSSRIELVGLNGQELLTKDKAAIRLNFTLSYVIEDPLLAVNSTSNVSDFLYNEVALAMRSVIGSTTLENLLTNREESAAEVLNIVKASAQSIGVKVQNGGIRDVILPGEMREILNKVLVAEKEAQANVIRRREETAAIRNSLNSAKLMESNPILLKLKEFELIERISEKVSSLNLSGSGQVLEQLRALTSKD